MKEPARFPENHPLRSFSDEFNQAAECADIQLVLLGELATAKAMAEDDLEKSRFWDGVRERLDQIKGAVERMNRSMLSVESAVLANYCEKGGAR